MKRFKTKPLIKYRFKDSMGCVFFRSFRTDREAHLWYERNRFDYAIKEFGSMGYTFKSRNLDSFAD